MMIRSFITGCFLLWGAAVFAQSAEEFYMEGKRRMEDRDYASAEKFFTRAITSCKDSAKYFIDRANTYWLLSEFNKAFTDLSTAIELDRNNPIPYLLRAALRTYSQPYESIKDGNMAIMLSSLDSIKYQAYTNNGAARLTVRDFEGAYNDFMKALSYDSLSPEVYTNLGYYYDEKGDTGMAVLYCLKAHLLDTGMVEPMANIGFIRSKAGNYKDALPYFDWSLKRMPDAAYVFNNRGYAKMKMGDLKGALKDIDHAIKLLPSNSYAYRNRALVYIEMKKFKKACTDLRKAAELGFKQEYGNEVEKLIQLHCN